MIRKLSICFALAAACAHAPAQKPAPQAPSTAVKPTPPRLLESDPKSAADDYRKALESEPAHPGATLNLARLLHDKPGEAEQVLRKTIAKRDPPEPELLDALAAVLRAQGKLDEARALVRQVLERHPRDADAYRNLAAIEADGGHVRLAESALNNARKLDDKAPGILNSLGLLALRRDDAAAARAWFDQATQLDANFAPAWANLGALALSYRDYAAAELAYAKAVQLDPTRWNTHLAHGWALEGLRRAKDARAEYEKVLALKPGQEDALYGRALALKAEGDLPAALQAFKEYAANSKATHLKEAQGQIASIDMRLKHPPATLPKAATAQKAAGAGLDLSKLPQGTDPGPSNEKLPADEGMGPGAPAEPAKGPDKTGKVPAAGMDGGAQDAAPSGAVQSAAVR
jgi:Flp pilus assembly protein TadD